MSKYSDYYCPEQYDPYGAQSHDFYDTPVETMGFSPHRSAYSEYHSTNANLSTPTSGHQHLRPVRTHPQNPNDEESQYLHDNGTRAQYVHDNNDTGVYSRHLSDTSTVRYLEIYKDSAVQRDTASIHTVETTLPNVVAPAVQRYDDPGTNTSLVKHEFAALMQDLALIVDALLKQPSSSFLSPIRSCEQEKSDHEAKRESQKYNMNKHLDLTTPGSSENKSSDEKLDQGTYQQPVIKDNGASDAPSHGGGQYFQTKETRQRSAGNTLTDARDPNILSNSPPCAVDKNETKMQMVKNEMKQLKTQMEVLIKNQEACMNAVMRLSKLWDDRDEHFTLTGSHLLLTRDDSIPSNQQHTGDRDPQTSAVEDITDQFKHNQIIEHDEQGALSLHINKPQSQETEELQVLKSELDVGADESGNPVRNARRENSTSEIYTQTRADFRNNSGEVTDSKNVSANPSRY